MCFPALQPRPPGLWQNKLRRQTNQSSRGSQELTGAKKTWWLLVKEEKSAVRVFRILHLKPSTEKQSCFTHCMNSEWMYFSDACIRPGCSWICRKNLNSHGGDTCWCAASGSHVISIMYSKSVRPCFQSIFSLRVVMPGLHVLSVKWTIKLSDLQDGWVDVGGEGETWSCHQN